MIDFRSKLARNRVNPKAAQDVALGMLDAISGDLRVFRHEIDAAAYSEVLATMEAAVTADRQGVAAYYRSNIALLMKSIGAELGECRSCGRSIWWVRTKTGKPAPFTGDGLNHFADCKTAAQHRRKS